jgi:hypothetical protein
MKNIQNYKADKYANGEYEEVEKDIYRIEDEDGDDLYVTSLSFVQEPEYKEGANGGEIADYPLEDILDKFYCHVSDFYTELNSAENQICYLEFGSPELQDVVNLRAIIGKHVYNKEEGEQVTLIIE